jgi:hypothetical protein
VTLHWAPFEVDGMSLEWCVQPSSTCTLLCIRLAGQADDGGAAQVLPRHAVPTVDDAVAAYRLFAPVLAANDTTFKG